MPEDAADALEEWDVSDYKELVRKLRGQAKQDGYTEYEAADALEKLSAEVERWRDPESDERQKLQEEIIFSLGDGARSEVELREGQLEQTEAALALDRAEVERLKRERDEALAARETYAMTARQDIIEKAKSLDELEAWMRADSVKLRRVSSIEPHEYEEGIVEMYVELNNDDLQSALAPTLAAAIRAALEKAKWSGQSGK